VGCFYLRAAADAATFTVTNTNDTGARIAGRRDERRQSGRPEAHNINFGPNAKGQITIASPLPVIANNVSINGPGSSVLTVSGGNTTRFLPMSAQSRSAA
jgi:hypothetical protein